MSHLITTYAGGQVHYSVDTAVDPAQQDANQPGNPGNTSEPGDIDGKDGSGENTKDGKAGGKGDPKSGTLTVQVVDAQGNVIQTLKMQVPDMIGDQSTTVTADGSAQNGQI